MSEFRFGRVTLEMLPRTAPGTELSAAELRTLESELSQALDDPMLARWLARFMGATVFFSRSSSGRSSSSTISEIAALPPGRSTRAISRHTWVLSGARLMTQFSTTLKTR